MITRKARAILGFTNALIWLLLSVSLVEASSQPDAALRAQAERWLQLLDNKETDSAAYAPLLANTPLQLQLLEGNAANLDQLAGKLKDRFEGVQSSRHRIDYFKIKPIDSGRYRVLMVVDWQLIGSDGLTEIARMEIRWTVHASDDGSLQIEQITEHYLPPLQGMGARIKC